MKDWLFKLLFPNQHKQLRYISELFKRSPDCRVRAPDGVCFKDIYVYLVTDASGSAINCEWVEIPC